MCFNHHHLEEARQCMRVNNFGSASEKKNCASTTNGMLASVLAVLTILGGSSVLPTGTFRGSVRPLLLPAQEIVVSTKGNNRGVVTLRGAVNADDEFWFDRQQGQWTIRFGPRVESAMTRVHARLVDFSYDEGSDRGLATVRLPVVGNVRVTLARVTI